MVTLPKPKDRPKKRFPAISALDKAFSIFIRKRDSWGGSGYSEARQFQCITCKVVKPYAQADCGHFLGRQYFATRWNPINCASQCRFCNRFNEGLKDKFRESLIQRHGETEILKLEAFHKQGRKPKDFERAEILARIKSDLAAL